MLTSEQEKILEWQEEEASIAQAVTDYKLDTMSHELLMWSAARWLLERNSFEQQLNESIVMGKRRVNTGSNYWLNGFTTNDAGEPNFFGKVINKYISKRNRKSAVNDRPRNGAKKPSKAELDAFRDDFEDKRKRNGDDGNYGWVKEASRKFGYSERQIGRIMKKNKT